LAVAQGSRPAVREIAQQYSARPAANRFMDFLQAVEVDNQQRCRCP
jgi:hypothetical protein